MHNGIIQLPDLEEDKEYTVSIRKRDRISKFTMVGDKMKALDLIANFSKPEAMVFILLKDNRDYETNISRLSTSTLTPTQRVVFSKGYTALAQKNLVIRLKKGKLSEYLFNPDFIIPSQYREVQKVWEQKAVI